MLVGVVRGRPTPCTGARIAAGHEIRRLDLRDLPAMRVVDAAQQIRTPVVLAA
jgi:hypothetical protein